MPTKITNEEPKYRIKEEVDIFDNREYMPQFKQKFLFFSWWENLAKSVQTLDSAEKFIRNKKRLESKKTINYKYY